MAYQWRRMAPGEIIIKTWQAGMAAAAAASRRKHQHGGEEKQSKYQRIGIKYKSGEKHLCGHEKTLARNGGERRATISYGIRHQ